MPLMTKVLENWSDVDINKFMDLHTMVVRASKDDFKTPYGFNIISYNNRQLERKEMKQKNIDHTEKLTVQIVSRYSTKHITVEFIFTLKSSFIDVNKYIVDNK